MNILCTLPTSKICRLIAVTLLPVAITGCAVTTSVTENPATKELPAMTKPIYSKNQRIVEFDNLNNNERFYEIIEVRNDGSYSGKSSNGCDWVAYGDFVSPSISWSKCSEDPKWHSGRHLNIKKKGDIWPLAIGNKVSYTYSQENALGEKQDRTTKKCKVTGTTNITVAAGDVDTFKVVCKRNKGSWNQTEVYYFSPELGLPVKYQRTSSSDGVQRDNEFLRTEQT